MTGNEGVGMVQGGGISTNQHTALLRLQLCGDVMTGRGIDQILAYPLSPVLHETYMKSAEGYVSLAESASGPIPRQVDWSYIWGQALPILAQGDLAASIINLETAVTRSENYWPGKAVHYRMNPDNMDCLRAAGITVCSLANNHVLDWGYSGLTETLAALDRAGIAHTGAGQDREQAGLPAVLNPADSNRRVLVFAYGMTSSGVGQDWAAQAYRPGVNLLPELGENGTQRVCEDITRYRVDGDLVVLSIHWGPNWGFRVDPAMRQFAHRLIDSGAVDIIHGHSSHHIKPFEIYRGKLILYGCGDFLNDYEGIGDFKDFRPELTLLYRVLLDSDTGIVAVLELIPFRIHRLQLVRASFIEAQWIKRMLDQHHELNCPPISVLPKGLIHVNLD
ncbi:CapA family protein [Marinobacter sp. SS21]|uniref:CapA family protein n=1 Tax=Marinobacter sp. SS21 TaxID=2979460 RepID=UPI00232B136C|nr:CapA family protein [Marinobacter sp. SS21]MDC0664289.1 CapA family protein [Marinobacter sp. SS21]